MKMLLLILAILMTKISAAQFDEQSTIQIEEDVFTVSYSINKTLFFVVSNRQFEKFFFLDNALENDCGMAQDSNATLALLATDQPTSVAGCHVDNSIKTYLPVFIKVETATSVRLEIAGRANEKAQIFPIKSP